MQVLVDQLRQKCLEEPRSSERPSGFSALTQSPKEFVEEVGGAGLLGWLLGGWLWRQLRLLPSMRVLPLNPAHNLARPCVLPRCRRRASHAGVRSCC